MAVDEQQVARWDSWNESGGPRYPHEKVVQFCFRNFSTAARGGVHALDFGCGGGVHTAFLAREGFRTSACDLSPVAIEHTRRRLAAEGLRADLHVASLDAVEYDPHSFDLVVCSGVLDACGIEVAQRGLARLPRLLTPGAKGVFLFASVGDFRLQGGNSCQLHGYSRAEVERIFSPFARFWIDEYITTYENGRSRQHDWLVTVFGEDRP